MGVLYEADLYTWSLEQAGLLRSGRFEEVDVTNLVEEIESMGRCLRRELVNRLDVLLRHLIKWQYQPGRRGSSWRLTIREQRLRLTEHLAESPGLKPALPEALATAWRYALLGAERVTGLPGSAFPSECPWTIDDVLDGAEPAGM